MERYCYGLRIMSREYRKFKGYLSEPKQDIPDVFFEINDENPLVWQMNLTVIQTLLKHNKGLYNMPKEDLYNYCTNDDYDVEYTCWLYRLTRDEYEDKVIRPNICGPAFKATISENTFVKRFIYDVMYHE